jgi:hypothetical protein
MELTFPNQLEFNENNLSRKREQVKKRAKNAIKRNVNRTRLSGSTREKRIDAEHNKKKKKKMAALECQSSRIFLSALEHTKWWGEGGQWGGAAGWLNGRVTVGTRRDERCNGISATASAAGARGTRPAAN